VLDASAGAHVVTGYYRPGFCKTPIEGGFAACATSADSGKIAELFWVWADELLWINFSIYSILRFVFLDISREMMKTTTLVCLLVLLAGCGKSAEEIERENAEAGMKVLAKRNHDLAESAKKYPGFDSPPRDGASSQGAQTKK
jgi:hypothetical protein